MLKETKNKYLIQLIIDLDETYKFKKTIIENNDDVLFDDEFWKSVIDFIFKNYRNEINILYYSAYDIEQPNNFEKNIHLYNGEEVVFFKFLSSLLWK